MNEDIKQLKKQYHVTNYDIGEYLDYSGDYIRCLLNKELKPEKRELIIKAINERKEVKHKNQFRKNRVLSWRTN